MEIKAREIGVGKVKEGRTKKEGREEERGERKGKEKKEDKREQCNRYENGSRRVGNLE